MVSGPWPLSLTPTTLRPRVTFRSEVMVRNSYASKCRAEIH